LYSDISQLIQHLADLFAALPQVKAIALGGSRSRTSNSSDSTSDIDLYVYTRQDVPLADRQLIVEQTGGATQANLNLNYWGPGDEWFNKPTGIEVDIVYFDANWMDTQIDSVLTNFQASQGYTTCFAYTISQSILFFDPQGWLGSLQHKCQSAYPAELQRNIINLNHPLLRGIIPAYAHQLEKAVKRQDLISINHRLTALFASYFDIIFAVNQQFHPGEKRLSLLTAQLCTRLPHDMQKDLNNILQTQASDLSNLPSSISTLLDHLDQLLKAEGFIQ
jgi:hypothetical protein